MAINSAKTNNSKGRFVDTRRPRQSNEPTQPAKSPPPGPFRSWRTLRLALVPATLVVILVAVAAWWFVKPLVSETLQAGQGAPCPKCAADDYIRNGPLGTLGGDDLLFERSLCHNERDKLKRQAHDFANAYRAAAQRYNTSPRLEIGVGTENVNGDKALLAMPITHNLERLGGIIDARHKHTWQFEVVNENGWRVCNVTMPDVCADLVNCEGPATQPTATPSARTWDIRVPYRCLPDKPYHDLAKDCGQPPADWIQPGPYYCAPDQPWGIDNLHKEECARLGWLS